MSLTQERETPSREGRVRSAPMAAAAKVYNGGIAALDASGNAVPGATATTLKCPGRACSTVDNTSGSAGALKVEIEHGIFPWKNSASGDAITRADIGNTCYIVDDETVAKTHGTNTRSAAGKVFDVDERGVWVDMR